MGRKRFGAATKFGSRERYNMESPGIRCDVSWCRSWRQSETPSQGLALDRKPSPPRVFVATWQECHMRVVVRSMQKLRHALLHELHAWRSCHVKARVLAPPPMHGG